MDGAYQVASISPNVSPSRAVDHLSVETRGTKYKDLMKVFAQARHRMRQRAAEHVSLQYVCPGEVVARSERTPGWMRSLSDGGPRLRVLRAVHPCSLAAGVLPLHTLPRVNVPICMNRGDVAESA
jgi:hypothetical protein